MLVTTDTDTPRITHGTSEPVVILTILGTLTGLRRFRQLVAGDLAELLVQDAGVAVYGVPASVLAAVTGRADALNLTTVRRRRGLAVQERRERW